MQEGTQTFIYIHAIWCTVNYQKTLTPIIRKVLFPYLRQYAVNKGLQAIAINGVENHIHCLFKLMPTQSATDVVKTLKNESAEWINSNKFLSEPFLWADNYAAYSVSPSTIDKAIDYINNQEEYHKTKQLEEELLAFTKMVVHLPN